MTGWTRVFGVCVAIVLATATTASATAGGPVLVNETTRVVDAPFAGDGPNCATGNLARSDGHFSGVIRVRVTADGSTLVSAHTKGTDSLDDYDPTPDGDVDATTTFIFNSVDSVFASGREIHTFVGTGTLTLTSDSSRRRFRAVVQLVVDADGVAVVNFARIECA